VSLENAGKRFRSKIPRFWLSAQRRGNLGMLALNDIRKQFKQKVGSFLAIEHRLNASRGIADLGSRPARPERNHQGTSQQRAARHFDRSK
jgi:hypothetical protein